MSLASLNVSLPRDLKSFVEKRVRNGGYATPSEYVRHLLRADQERTARRQLEDLLLDGLNSGESIEADAKFWEDLRRQLVARRKKSRK